MFSPKSHRYSGEARSRHPARSLFFYSTVWAGCPKTTPTPRAREGMKNPVPFCPSRIAHENNGIQSGRLLSTLSPSSEDTSLWVLTVCFKQVRTPLFRCASRPLHNGLCQDSVGRTGSCRFQSGHTGQSFNSCFCYSTSTTEWHGMRGTVVPREVGVCNLASCQ